MGDRWLPWSAASLASGAVLVVLGTSALPAVLEVSSLLKSAQTEDSMWLVAAAAFMLAAVALVLGLPAIYSLLPAHRTAIGVTGLWVWSFGMIGTAGLASLLVGFRALVHTMDLTPEQARRLGEDPGMASFFVVVVGAFYLGELIVALTLLTGRTVGRWVPVLMLLHLALAFVNQRLPAEMGSAQSIVLAVALVGIAMKASDNWVAVRAHDRV